MVPIVDILEVDEPDVPNQLEDDELLVDELNHDEFVVDFTEFRNGVNVFETYWVTAVAISLLLHSIHDIGNASHCR